MIILCFKVNICPLFLILNDTTNYFKCISTLKFSSETKTLVRLLENANQSFMDLLFCLQSRKKSTYSVRGLFLFFFSIAAKFNQFYQLQVKIQYLIFESKLKLHKVQPFTRKLIGYQYSCYFKIHKSLNVSNDSCFHSDIWERIQDYPYMFLYVHCRGSGDRLIYSMKRERVTGQELKKKAHFFHYSPLSFPSQSILSCSHPQEPTVYLGLLFPLPRGLLAT